MMGFAKLLISWDMAPLTAPFVLTAWLLLFALYQFGQLDSTKLIGPMCTRAPRSRPTCKRPLVAAGPLG